MILKKYLYFKFTSLICHNKFLISPAQLQTSSKRPILWIFSIIFADFLSPKFFTILMNFLH